MGTKALEEPVASFNTYDGDSTFLWNHNYQTTQHHTQYCNTELITEKQSKTYIKKQKEMSKKVSCNAWFIFVFTVKNFTYGITEKNKLLANTHNLKERCYKYT